MATFVGMIGRINQEKKDLSRLVERAENLMEKARKSGEDGFLDGVALNLHGFYTAVERILEDIARTCDGEIPRGGGWHKRLLVQMAAEIPGFRPPVIGRDTWLCLEEYRAFRHVVRNVYAFQLHPPRLEELVAGLRDCMETVSSDLERFQRFLQGLSNSTV